MTRILNEPEHWRQRAAEARAIAEQMSSPEAKATMLRIVEGYDKMEQHAAERQLSQKKVAQ